MYSVLVSKTSSTLDAGMTSNGTAKWFSGTDTTCSSGRCPTPARRCCQMSRPRARLSSSVRRTFAGGTGLCRSGSLLASVAMRTWNACMAIDSHLRPLVRQLDSVVEGEGTHARRWTRCQLCVALDVWIGIDAHTEEPHGHAQREGDRPYGTPLPPNTARPLRVQLRVPRVG